MHADRTAGRLGSACPFYGGVPYGKAGGRELLLDLLLPAEPVPSPRPVAVYLHGGAWRMGDRAAAMHPWLAPQLARAGYVTVAPTYRLSGEAAWPAPLDDVREALRWVRGHAAGFGADAGRVGLWGHSAGAHLAAMLALTSTGDETVQAVALSACPSDLRPSAGMVPEGGDEVTAALLGDPTDDRLAAASPVCNVRAGAPPFLIAHGSADSVVPLAQGERLRDALRAEGVDVRWLSVSGADHDWADLLSARGYGEAGGTPVDGFGAATLAFFEEVLRPSA